MNCTPRWAGILLAVTLGLVFGAAPALAEETWDPAEDFSLDGNPNGVWSYGRKATPTSTSMTESESTDTTFINTAGLHAWHADPSVGGYNCCPSVAKNITTSDIKVDLTTFAPGQLVLHPDRPEQAAPVSVLRFTAPTAGVFEVDATFVGRTPRYTTVNVAIVDSTGTALFSASLVGSVDDVDGTRSHTTTVSLGAGEHLDFTVHSIDLAAWDSTGLDLTITCTNEAPNCDAGTNQSVECTSADGATVSLSGSASDPDGDALSYSWSVPAGISLDSPTSASTTGVFPVGITTATLTVTDGNGGVCTDDVVITVTDTTPPEVHCTTDLASLTRPNHKMRSVFIVLLATDACDNPDDIELVEVTVSSNEPDEGLGDGDTAGDVDGADGYAAPVEVTAAMSYDTTTGTHGGFVDLRAERSGTGEGRVYTITAVFKDSFGNTGTSSCVVVVPHDRRGK